MRFFISFLLQVTFVCVASSQHIFIEYAGAPLSDSYKKQTELFLKHGYKFYQPFGLPDTLKIKLNISDNEKDWKDVLISNKAYKKQYSIQPKGLYSTKTHECHIMLSDGMKSINMGLIRHELSHFLTHKIMGNNPIPWLYEGLSEYFFHCKVTAKGLKHSLDPYEKGRLRTMFMLNEIEPEDVLDYNIKEFSQAQKTNDRITYITAHALVTFLIEGAPQDYFAQLITLLKDSSNTTRTSQKIDKTYPGGLKKFIKDFTVYYGI